MKRLLFLAILIVLVGSLFTIPTQGVEASNSPNPENESTFFLLCQNGQISSLQVPVSVEQGDFFWINADGNCGRFLITIDGEVYAEVTSSHIRIAIDSSLLEPGLHYVRAYLMDDNDPYWSNASQFYATINVTVSYGIDCNDQVFYVNHVYTVNAGPPNNARTGAGLSYPVVDQIFPGEQFVVVSPIINYADGYAWLTVLFEGKVVRTVSGHCSGLIYVEPVN